MTNNTERKAFEGLLAAAKNLRQVKGRFHSEQASNQLWDAIDKAEAMLSSAPAPSLCTAEEAAELAKCRPSHYEANCGDYWLLNDKQLAAIINADRAKR